MKTIKPLNYQKVSDHQFIDDHINTFKAIYNRIAEGNLGVLGQIINSTPKNDNLK